LQRTYSLKKNAQFKYVYRRGASAGAREMVMLYVRGPVLKVGFSVGKKLGCAVQRNRIKRRLCAVAPPDEAGAVCVHRPPARRGGGV